MKISYFFIPIILFFINSLLLKKKFFIDEVKKNLRDHKNLINNNKKFVPVSGGFFFIVLFSFFNNNFDLIIFCSILLALLGLASDSEKISLPSLRLFFQFVLVLLFLSYSQKYSVDTRIEFFDEFLKNEYFALIFLSFCLLIVINGCNFIDGVNCLLSLNILIVSVLAFFLIQSYNIDLSFDKGIFIVFIFGLCIFVILNFFSLNFLGDGGAYTVSFFLSIILLEIYQKIEMSPYFICLLLWYPAFENFFSIIRRSKKNKKFHADNKHFHQYLYLYIKKKNFIFLKNYTSSITGILINLYLLAGYIIGFFFITKTNVQVTVILVNILIYILLYFIFSKKLKMN